MKLLVNCILAICLGTVAQSIFLPNLQQYQASQLQDCEYCQNENTVKGINFLGGALNIMYDDPSNDVLQTQGLSSLFVLCCGNNTLEDSYGNIIPEGINLYPIYQTVEQSTPQISTNITQYQQANTQQINIRPFSFQRRFQPFRFRGYWNQKTQNIQQNFILNKAIYNKIFVQIKNYQLSIGDISMMNLNQYTINKIQNLPINYTTDQDKQSYQRFFKDVGTHYLKSIILGGMVVNEIQGNITYQPVNNINNIYNNENISNSSYTQQRSYIGGQPGVYNDFQQWLQSIQDYPGVVNQDISPISEIFSAKNVQNIPNISQLQANMEQALFDYFNIVGCTDPLASNYNASAIEDDGSCVYNYYYGFYITDSCYNNQFGQKNEFTKDLRCPYQSQPVIYTSHLYYPPNNPQQTSCSNLKNSQYCNMTIYLCTSQNIQTNLSGYSVCSMNQIWSNVKIFNQVNSFNQQMGCPQNTIDISMAQFTSYAVYQNGQQGCGSLYQYLDVTCQDHICIPEQYKLIQSSFVVINNNQTQFCPNSTVQVPFYAYNVSNTEYQQAYFCMYQP